MTCEVRKPRDQPADGGVTRAGRIGPCHFLRTSPKARSRAS
jgi:hypothetical protein